MGSDSHLGRPDETSLLLIVYSWLFCNYIREKKYSRSVRLLANGEQHGSACKPRKTVIFIDLCCIQRAKIMSSSNFHVVQFN